MDKRKKSRVLLKIKSTLTAVDKSVEGDVENLSLDGMFILTGDRFPAGTDVDIKLKFTGETSKLTLLLKGRVTREENRGLALNFTDIDTDSFLHLRNIITHDIVDEKKIARDFDNIDIDEKIRD